MKKGRLWRFVRRFWAGCRRRGNRLSGKPDGRVINRLGEDVTEQFQKGAEEALRIFRETGCTSTILKSKSPSCGVGIIHNGKFDGGLVKGNGILAELLLAEGIPVMTETDYANSIKS